MSQNNSRNIIVVDDDPVSVQICNMVFKRTMPDAKIQVFENGLDALKWINVEGRMQPTNDSFVVLLDLNMPVVDGWGFLNDFEKSDVIIQTKFHIYIMTASEDDKDIERAKQFQSIKGFHVKPLTHKIINQIFAEVGV